MNTKIADIHNAKYSGLRRCALGIVLLLILGSPAMSVYAKQPSVPLAQQEDYSGLLLLLSLGWIGLGIWGMAKIIQKGYLSDTTCAVWGVLILFGWWAIPILLGLGPVWLGIAAMLEGRKRCPHCRIMIPQSATRCGHCQADLAASEKALPPVAKDDIQKEQQTAEMKVCPCGNMVLSTVTTCPVCGRDISQVIPRVTDIDRIQIAQGQSKKENGVCPNCNHNNPIGVPFCQRCGKPLR
jgi:hypothetical protein